MNAAARRATWALVPCLAVGLALQAVNDAAPPVTLSYLTVLSALGLLAVSGWALAGGGPARGAGGTTAQRRRAFVLARGMLTTASLASGVGYLLLIAPREGEGYWLLDSPRALAASVLLHVAAPVLAVVACRADGDRVVLVGAGGSGDSGAGFGRAARVAATWLGWPTAWLALALVAEATGLVTMPYPFLRASDVGWWGVLGAAAVSAVAWWLTGMALLAPTRRRDGTR